VFVTVPLKIFVAALLVAWDFLDYPLSQRGLGLADRLDTTKWIVRSRLRRLVEEAAE